MNKLVLLTSIENSPYVFYFVKQKIPDNLITKYILDNFRCHHDSHCGSNSANPMDDLYVGAYNTN